MNIQSVRLKLQKRFASLNNSPWDEFPGELKRFMHFLASEPSLVAALVQLMAGFPSLRVELEGYFARNMRATGATHAEMAAIGYIVLDRVSRATDAERGLAYMRYVNHTSDASGMLNEFRRQYARPLYEAVDEQLQDSNIILGELMRAKHAIEWFMREDFYSDYNLQTGRGEKTVGWKLYGLLYERGVEFSIEPASISGEADMVASQNSEHPLIADVKIFDPSTSRGSSYIKKGVSQVFTYLEDYNQTVGYLVIFAVSSKTLRVTDCQSSEGVPSLTIHGKTIFLIQIDIYPHEQSASKRQEDVELVTASELCTDIAEGRVAPSL
jgi:hypothetical protein